MSESKLATFRIDKERWDKFVLLAKDNDSNASKLIIGFIDACIDNRIDLNIYTITPPKSTVSNIGIDEYLDSHLDTRIDSYLKKNLSSYIANCIDNLATKELIETELAPIVESVEIAKPKITRTKRNDKDYPDNITGYHQQFYDVLIDNPELRAKVISILKDEPTSTRLGKLLFDEGIKRANGTAYTKDHAAKIKHTIEVILGREKPWIDLP